MLTRKSEEVNYVITDERRIVTGSEPSDLGSSGKIFAAPQGDIFAEVKRYELPIGDRPCIMW